MSEKKEQSIYESLREKYEGIVKSKGSFFNEPPYVPYFYDLLLEGFHDEVAGDIYLFYIREIDSLVFPELTNRHSIKLYYDGSAFVYEVNLKGSEK